MEPVEETLEGPSGDKTLWLESESARTPLRFRDRVLAQFQSPANIKYLRDVFKRSVPNGPTGKFAQETLQDAMLNFNDRALDLLMSDTIARRGALRTGVDMWSEVRRLNRAFVKDRLHLFAETSQTLNESKKGATGNELLSADGEDYAMRMFIADSLRPPGLEHLNNPGPLFALEEDQEVRPEWGGDKQIRADKALQDVRERFAAQGPPQDPPSQRRLQYSRTQERQKLATAQSNNKILAMVARVGANLKKVWRWKDQPTEHKRTAATIAAPVTTKATKAIAATKATKAIAATKATATTAATELKRRTQPSPSKPEVKKARQSLNIDLNSDEPWDEGNPNRKPHEAIAEYWGSADDDVDRNTQTKMGSAERTGVVAGDLYSWGSQWKENGGTRFMRYEGIPFWQKRSREGVDRDIEETLGTAGRELGSHVRRWETDRIRKPGGEEYRRYGARHG